MAGFTDALQAVLTQGIDAAKSIKLAELQVSNPNLNTVGPYGIGGESGQGVYPGAAVLSQVPPIAWVAGLGLLAALVLVRVLKR